MGDGKPRVGDRVRVTVEGEVNYTEAVGFTVFDHPQPPNGNGMFLRYDDAIIKNIEIIYRTRQVGDKIEQDELKNWPSRSGTLIIRSNRMFMKMTTGHWIDTQGLTLLADRMPTGTYTILYLPEWS